MKLTLEDRSTLELLVLKEMQHLDRNNKTRSADYKHLDAIWAKLRAVTLTEADEQDQHNKCF